MRSLLRVLVLIALASYLWSHYGGFLRQKLSTADEQRVPAPESPSLINSRPVLPQPAFLPRRDLTPGAIDPRVKQSNTRSTICRRGYTASVRPPFEYTNTMKHRLMRIYGVSGNIHDYELDHLIPLELGGCPECETNLWPQARNVFPGASEKDEVEDFLHHQVCSGALPLAEAQREIAHDWYAVYERIRRRAGDTARRRRRITAEPPRSRSWDVSSKAGHFD